MKRQERARIRKYKERNGTGQYMGKKNKENVSYVRGQRLRIRKTWLIEKQKGKCGKGKGRKGKAKARRIQWEW